ncbi:MAG TPA: ubiquitin-like domain-containing protein, partial [Patescibacteria group bacterium]
MKKRYVASPILLLTVATVWNVVFKADTPKATAEDIQNITAPQIADSRHPIEVFQVGVGSGETENDVLAQLSTVVYPEDKVRFLIDPKFGLGTVVHIERALPVTIKDGKRVITVRTWDNTVGELLDSV